MRGWRTSNSHLFDSIQLSTSACFPNRMFYRAVVSTPPTYQPFTHTWPVQWRSAVQRDRQIPREHACCQALIGVALRARPPLPDLERSDGKNRTDYLFPDETTVSLNIGDPTT
ncbi:hypothetical protein MESS4_50007 [Mesorhizobium sp. STM 4661]|nr:hypothetical protein MESS4_50007 [Mesorhizobium sp. STM 4661]